jgi:hypothetical protein
MKTLFTVLLAAISLTIFSCNKETATTQTSVKGEPAIVRAIRSF